MNMENIHANHFILITDGESVQGGLDIIKKVDLNQGPRWSFCEVHIVNENPDLTVAAGFINNVPFSLSSLHESDICKSKLANIDDAVKTINNVNDEKELSHVFYDIMGTIKAYKILRNLPEVVHDALIRLNKRILSNAAKAATAAAAAAASANATAAAATAKKPLSNFPNFPNFQDVLQMASAGYAVKSASATSSQISQLLSACIEKSSFSIEYVRSKATSRMAQTPNTQIIEDEAHKYGQAVNVDWFNDINDINDTTANATATWAMYFKGLGSAIIDIKEDYEFFKQVARNPLCIITSKYWDALKARYKGMAPVANVAGVVPCCVFAKGDVWKESLKSCVANVVFGQDQFYGSYDLWVVVMWHLANEPGIKADKFLDKNEFFKDFVNNESTAMLGLDPTNTRSMCKGTLRQAFLYTASAWTQYANTDPAQDPLRELYRVYPVIHSVLQLVDAAIPPGTDAYVDELQLMSKLLYQIKNGSSSKASVIKNIRCNIFKTLTFDLDADADAADDADAEAEATDANATNADANAANAYRFLLDELLDANVSTNADSERDIKINMHALVLIQDGIIHAGISGIGSIKIHFDDLVKSKIPYECKQRFFDADENNAEFVSETTVPIHFKTLRPCVGPFMVWFDDQTQKARPKGISLYRRILDYYFRYNKFPEMGNARDMMKLLRILEQKDAINGLLPVNILKCCEAVIDNMSNAMERRLALLGPQACTVEAVREDLTTGTNRSARILMENRFPEKMKKPTVNAFSEAQLGIIQGNFDALYAAKANAAAVAAAAIRM